MTQKTWPILLDVMLNGRFLCQVSYNRPPAIKFYDTGKPEYDKLEFINYVSELMPHLKGNIEVIPAKQKVKRRTIKSH